MLAFSIIGARQRQLGQGYRRFGAGLGQVLDRYGVSIWDRFGARLGKVLDRSGRPRAGLGWVGDRLGAGCDGS